MYTSDYAFATAVELTTAMDAHEVSAVELAEDAIARIEHYDVSINAVCVRDFDRALIAAGEADDARAKGQRTPLLGVPMTVKESFNVAGLPTTWGMSAFAGFIADEDAVAVARVRAAGAVVLGKTNVPAALGDLQTYNPIYGTTNNPWDHARTPGGSSGGSAAALAAGFGAVSIGSDLAGSLRIPAHFSGVYAHKPTFGLLPTRGHTAPPSPPLAYDRDLTVVGPMARSAADLGLLLNLLAEPDDTALGKAHRLALRPARHEGLADYRVLVLDTHPLIPTSSGVRIIIDRLAGELSAAGVRVERHSRHLPDLTEGARIYMRLLLSSIAAAYPPGVYDQARAAAEKIDAGDTSLFAERTRGAVLSHRAWMETDSLRAQHRAGWDTLFRHFDIVLCPVAPTVAFAHDQSTDQWARTISIDGADHDYADQLVWAGTATAPGLPVSVVPVDRTADGLPVGVQLIGPMFEDRMCIRFAELFEEEFGGFSRPNSM